MRLKWNKEVSDSSETDVRIVKRFEISNSHMSSSVNINGSIFETISIDLTTKDLIEIRDYINFLLDTYDMIYKSK